MTQKLKRSPGIGQIDPHELPHAVLNRVLEVLVLCHHLVEEIGILKVGEYKSCIALLPVGDFPGVFTDDFTGQFNVAQEMVSVETIQTIRATDFLRFFFL